MLLYVVYTITIHHAYVYAVLKNSYQCNNSCHCRSHILCYMILFYIWQISKCDACQRYEKIKTVAPKLTPIKIVAPMHMVGIDLVGRPSNVKPTDVILTQCNVDFCQCTQELIFIFML